MFANTVLKPAPGPALVDPAICRIAQHIVAEAMAPCAAICVAAHRSDGWQLRTGTAGGAQACGPYRLSADTPFDLASVSKPCVALTAANLASRRQLSLSGAIGTYLPEISRLPIADATLDMLLSHRSGLKPHIELFGAIKARCAISRSTLLRMIGLHGVTPEHAHSDRCNPAVYSDLGYLLAGVAIERHLKAPLDRLVADLLCRNLGLKIGSSRQWRQSVADFARIVAPTEFVSWRGGVIRGQVHDENAWAFAGYGLAGHAGLFGTAPAVAGLGCAVLDALAGRGSALDVFAVHYCTGSRNRGTLRAGFDGKSHHNSSAGEHLSSCSFGHLGFTGTSLWCDPHRDIVIALLTNRVCPTRRNTRLGAARALIHDSLVHYAQSTFAGDS